MSAQQFLTLESNHDKARRLHSRLAEIGEMLINLDDFGYQPGMAILRSPQDIADGVESVRILEHTRDRLTVYDPGVGVRTVHEQTYPVVDVSDPATFGYVFKLGWTLSDSEADDAYSKLDFGSLDCSAYVLIRAIQDRLPF